MNRIGYLEIFNGQPPVPRGTPVDPGKAQAKVPSTQAPAETIARRQAICEDCSEWSVSTDSCKLGCKRCALTDAAASCPATPPRWGPLTDQTKENDHAL